ncbi:hypothetical protein HYW21_00310 [Candidatus Woesearchaeota archaeon]|nr:hypothetical protein [Candidatus Woesearchaeota archaeon]
MPEALVAYLSSEIFLHPNLAIPAVGVTLRSHRGYMNQGIDAQGKQIAKPVPKREQWLFLYQTMTRLLLGISLQEQMFGSIHHAGP